MSTTGPPPVPAPEPQDPVPEIATEVAGRRYVAPGGWKRAMIGLVVGMAAGAVVATVLPRRGGARRHPPAG